MKIFILLLIIIQGIFTTIVPILLLVLIGMPLQRFTNANNKVTIL